MNIALEDTKEVVNGRVRKNYGDAFIRGNNGEWLDHSILKTADAYDVLQSCTSQQTHEATSAGSTKASNILSPGSSAEFFCAGGNATQPKKRLSLDYYCDTMLMPEKSKHLKML